MVGGLRERTASMISIGSMPWRYAEVVPRSMSELPLDDVDRNALTREFDGVGVAQLMGRESPAHAHRNGELMQLGARRGRCPAASAGATIDHAEQWSGRQQHALPQPRVKLFEPELVHAGFAALVALCCAGNYVAQRSCGGTGSALRGAVG